MSSTNYELGNLSNAPINPYFISFIAIISGLLSERALETLRRIGSDYFSGNDPEEPERWALGALRGHFETIKRDPHQLKDAVGVDEKQIDDWIISDSASGSTLDSGRR